MMIMTLPTATRRQHHHAEDDDHDHHCDGIPQPVYTRVLNVGRYSKTAHLLSLKTRIDRSGAHYSQSFKLKKPFARTFKTHRTEGTARRMPGHRRSGIRADSKFPQGQVHRHLPRHGDRHRNASSASVPFDFEVGGADQRRHRDPCRRWHFPLTGTTMSRLRSASSASYWSGNFEPRRRDIAGDATEDWAAQERRQRGSDGRHGITDRELQALLRAIQSAATATCSLAA
jgi:hypothetical protein